MKTKNAFITLKLMKEVTEQNPGEGTSAMAMYVEAEKPKKKAAPKPKVSIL